MVKLVSAKCPSCGANLKLSKDEEKTVCEYCNNSIVVDDAIACYKLKISGNVSVEGISTNSDLIEAANELLDMNEYLKAKRKFLEFSEKCPDNYQGWLGLLICRTRNFKIRDNNIMFENDVNNYYEHFLRVAPDDVIEQYKEIIDNYFNPGGSDEGDESSSSNIKETPKKVVTNDSTISNNLWLWVLGWIFFFPIPLTVLIWRSNWSKTVKIIVTIILWLFLFAIGSAESDETTDTNISSEEQNAEISYIC